MHFSFKTASNIYMFIHFFTWDANFPLRALQININPEKFHIYMIYVGSAFVALENSHENKVIVSYISALA